MKTKKTYNNYFKPGKERLNTMRKVLITALALCFTINTWAANDTLMTRLEELESGFNRVMSKAGIHFGGEFRAQMLGSRAEGDFFDINQGKTYESVEFTSVDFDITARPNEAIGGRAMFRLHSDWRNLFSGLASQVYSRWVSIDGTVNNMFSYHAGDYSKRVSPLTVWNPEIEIMYEPEIFALHRRVAMGEQFLGNNNRVLQGMDIAMDAGLAPILDQFHFSFYGARLRSSGTGESHGTVIPSHLPDPMDSWFLGSNLDLALMAGVRAALTYQRLFDNEYTFRGTLDRQTTPVQETRLLDGRLNLSSALFMPTDMIEIGIDAEGALSFDERVKELENGPEDEVELETITGMAINSDLFASININNTHRFKLSGGLIKNEKDFRNELAQSPSYIGLDPRGDRIMNTEITAENEDGFEMGNVFDRMYRNVFRLAASGLRDDWVRGGQTKLAYTNAIVSVDDEKFQTFVDPRVQLVLPYGLATPNVQGLKGSLQGSLFDRGVSFGVNFNSLSEVTPQSLPIDGTDPTEYLEFPATEWLELGYGLSTDISKFVGVLPGALVLSFSGKLSSMENAGIAGTVPASTRDNMLTSLGLEWNFYRRFTILAGMQNLSSEYNDGISVAGIETMLETHSQRSLGLRTGLGEASSLTFLLSRVTTELDYHIDVDDGTGTMISTHRTPSAHMSQPEVFLTVTF